MTSFGDLPPSRCLPESSEDFSLHDAALFLDVDGTLLELAAKPDAVVVEPALLELLHRLSLASEGAIALVSGRSIETLDELFAPLVLPIAGLHGLERRNASGVYYRKALPPDAILDRTRQLMKAVAMRHPSLVLEDKRSAIALHYRRVAGLEHEIVADVTAVSRRGASQLRTQRGNMVIEVLPKGSTQAQAVAEFMNEPPFNGRRPIYLGDDLSDECAFEWVNAHGGLSVAVNVARKTSASMQLTSVPDAREWLCRLLSRAPSC